MTPWNSFSTIWDEGLSFFGKAEQSAAVAGDYVSAGWHAYQVGFLHRLRGEADAVFNCADRVARHWENANMGSTGEATVNELRGFAHKMKKDFPTALTFFRAVLEMRRGIVNRSIPVADALNHVAQIERSLGDFPAADEHYREALEIAAAHDYKAGVAVFTGNLAALALYREDWPAAERLAREALPLSEAIGRLEAIAANKAMLADALVEQGKATEALPLAQFAEETFRRLGSPEVEYAQQVLDQCKTASAEAGGG